MSFRERTMTSLPIPKSIQRRLSGSSLSGSEGGKGASRSPRIFRRHSKKQHLQPTNVQDVLKKYHEEEDRFLVELEALQRSVAATPEGVSEMEEDMSCASVSPQPHSSLPPPPHNHPQPPHTPTRHKSFRIASSSCTSPQTDLLGSFCHLMNYVIHLRKENRHLRKQVACLTEMRKIEKLKNELFTASCTCSLTVTHEESVTVERIHETPPSNTNHNHGMKPTNSKIPQSQQEPTISKSHSHNNGVNSNHQTSKTNKEGSRFSHRLSTPTFFLSKKEETTNGHNTNTNVIVSHQRKEKRQEIRTFQFPPSKNTNRERDPEESSSNRHETATINHQQPPPEQQQQHRSATGSNPHQHGSKQNGKSFLDPLTSAVVTAVTAGEEVVGGGVGDSGVGGRVGEVRGRGAGRERGEGGGEGAQLSLPVYSEGDGDGRGLRSGGLEENDDAVSLTSEEVLEAFSSPATRREAEKEDHGKKTLQHPTQQQQRQQPSRQQQQHQQQQLQKQFLEPPTETVTVRMRKQCRNSLSLSPHPGPRAPSSSILQPSSTNRCRQYPKISLIGLQPRSPSLTVREGAQESLATPPPSAGTSVMSEGMMMDPMMISSYSADISSAADNSCSLAPSRLNRFGYFPHSPLSPSIPSPSPLYPNPPALCPPSRRIQQKPIQEASDSDDQPVFTEVSLPVYDPTDSNRRSSRKSRQNSGQLEGGCGESAYSSLSPSKSFVTDSTQPPTTSEKHSSGIAQHQQNRATFLQRLGIRKKVEKSSSSGISISRQSREALTQSIYSEPPGSIYPSLILDTARSNLRSSITSINSSRERLSGLVRKAFVKKRKRKISESDSLGSSETSGRPYRVIHLPEEPGSSRPLIMGKVDLDALQRNLSPEHMKKMREWEAKKTLSQKGESGNNTSDQHQRYFEKSMDGGRQNTVIYNDPDPPHTSNTTPLLKIGGVPLPHAVSEGNLQSLSESRKSGGSPVEGGVGGEGGGGGVGLGGKLAVKSRSVTFQPSDGRLGDFDHSLLHLHPPLSSLADSVSLGTTPLTMSEESVFMSEDNSANLLDHLLNLQEKNSLLLKRLREKSKEYESMSEKLVNLEREVRVMKGRYRLDACVEKWVMGRSSELNLVPVSMLHDLEGRLRETDDALKKLKQDALKTQQEALEKASREQSWHEKCWEKMEELQKTNFQLMQRQLSDLSLYDPSLRQRLQLLPTYDTLYSFTLTLIRKLRSLRNQLTEKQEGMSRMDLELLHTQSSLLIAHAQIERQKLTLRTHSAHPAHPHPLTRPHSFHGDDYITRTVNAELSFYLPFKLQGRRSVLGAEREEREKEDKEEEVEEDFLNLFHSARNLSRQSSVDVYGYGDRPTPPVHPPPVPPTHLQHYHNPSSIALIHGYAHLPVVSVSPLPLRHQTPILRPQQTPTLLHRIPQSQGVNNGFNTTGIWNGNHLAQSSFTPRENRRPTSLIETGTPTPGGIIVASQLSHFSPTPLIRRRELNQQLSNQQSPLQQRYQQQQQQQQQQRLQQHSQQLHQQQLQRHILSHDDLRTVNFNNHQHHLQNYSSGPSEIMDHNTFFVHQSDDQEQVMGDEMTANKVKTPPPPLKLGNVGQVRTLAANFDVSSAPNTPLSKAAPHLMQLGVAGVSSIPSSPVGVRIAPSAPPLSSSDHIDRHYDTPASTSSGGSGRYAIYKEKTHYSPEDKGRKTSIPLPYPASHKDPSVQPYAFTKIPLPHKTGLNLLSAVPPPAFGSKIQAASPNLSHRSDPQYETLTLPQRAHFSAESPGRGLINMDKSTTSEASMSSVSGGSAEAHVDRSNTKVKEVKRRKFLFGPAKSNPIVSPPANNPNNQNVNNSSTSPNASQIRRPGTPNVKPLLGSGKDPSSNNPSSKSPPIQTEREKKRSSWIMKFRGSKK